MAHSHSVNPNTDEDRRTLKSLGLFLGSFAVFTLVLALAVAFFGPAL